MNTKSNVKVKTTKTNQRLSVSMALIAAVAILAFGSTSTIVIAHRDHHSNAISSNGDQNCNNSQGTCGNTSADTDYENGLDAGTRAAESAIPACGSDSSCYSDYSISDCVDSTGSDVQNPAEYCSGFVRGYYDTAGLPQLIKMVVEGYEVMKVKNV